MTPKQEAFARAYVETGNASEAYRQAYDAEDMGNNTIHVNACKLLKHDKIRLRIDELQERAAKKHDVTIDSLMRELEEARSIAIANPRSVSAAVSATMGKAKLAGLVVDKAEHTGANGSPLVPVLNVSLSRNQS